MQKMNLIINKNTIKAFLSLLLYKIVLDLSYYFVISPVWSYAKFDLNLNNLKLIESFFLFFIISILMPKTSKKLSNIIIWLLILLSYIPMLTLFSFMDQPRSYMYAVTGFWILVFLLLQLPMPKLLITSFKKTQSKGVSYIIYVSLSIIIIILIFRYFKLTINFDFSKIADTRSLFAESKAPFIGYFFPWMGYILNPIFFSLFLIKKKWINVILVIFIQLLLFSYTGSRAFFFAIPTVLILIWMITIARKNLLCFMAIALSGIILLGMLSYCLMDSVWISSNFTRRTLLVPAQLSFLYYDFFSKNQFTFLSQHRIFRTFLDYPYYLNPAHLIANIYFNRPQMGANNGIYADAYMNFGFIGLVLWGIFLVIILSLIDSITKNKDIRVTISGIVLPVVTLTNSALLTCLLTHGLLLALIILYLLPKERNEII